MLSSNPATVLISSACWWILSQNTLNWHISNRSARYRMFVIYNKIIQIIEKSAKFIQFVGFPKESRKYTVYFI